MATKKRRAGPGPKCKMISTGKGGKKSKRCWGANGKFTKSSKKK